MVPRAINPIRGISRFGLVGACCAGGWAIGAVIAAAPAAACAINPGTGTCAPDMLTLSPSATLVSHTTQTISITDQGTTLTATYTENVYRDPTSNYSSTCGTNCLTWILQVTNDNAPTGGNPASNDVIHRITANNFSGFLTDIGVNTNGVPASQSAGLTSTGTQAPVNVERSGTSPQGTGATMAWDFSDNTTDNNVQPGQTTVLLEIETNSTQDTPGTVSVQDNLATGGPGFSPAVPEGWVPGIGLAGGAAVGFFALRRRKRQGAEVGK